MHAQERLILPCPIPMWPRRARPAPRLTARHYFGGRGNCRVMVVPEAEVVVTVALPP